MRQISLLVKPASSLCNMRCRYCFYADESEHRMRKSMGIMSMETAEQLIRAAFAAAGPRGAVSFSFQGGEPTLAGLDFFREFTETADRLNANRSPVAWAIQTNGLNIDERWAEFLKSRGFLAGVSVDGDQDLHDAFRPDASGKGTYTRVADRVRLLLDRGVETNLLCVVNGKNVRRPKQVYRALKKLGTGYLQFIPCLDPLGSDRGGMPWSLKPDDYSRFLCGVFDEWVKDLSEGRYVSVRHFDDWVHLAMGLPPGTCAACGRCGGYLAVEADGGLYPCDFYVLDEWKLGSVQDSLSAVLQSEKMRAFRARGQNKPAECAGCPWFSLCRGGCPRDWYTDENGPHNYFCPAFRHFFAYAGGRIFAIADQFRRVSLSGGPR